MDEEKRAELERKKREQEYKRIANMVCHTN